MVRGLPEDGNRYETVRGELLVTPAPREPHQWVLGRLYLSLGNYLEQEGIRGLYFSPADISWGADTLVQPDLFVVAEAEADTREWARMRTLLLTVEVVSASSTRADHFTKRHLYQDKAVQNYWVVDVDRKEVELWTPDSPFPTVARERLVWRHPAATGSCIIPLARLFDRG
jgi:Uma2 family endonuclease